MALVIEDGTGLANADTYVSALEVSSILESLGRNDLFDALSTDDKKESTIRSATIEIDSYLDQKVEGTRVNPNQSLVFPRYRCLNGDHILIEGIPEELKKASSLACYYILLKGASKTPSIERISGVRSLQARDYRVDFSTSRDFVYVSIEESMPLVYKFLKRLVYYV